MLLGCSHAAHVRDGHGCVDDSPTVTLAVPANGDVPPAVWVIVLDTPLSPGRQIRVSQAKAAEYLEGVETPSFASKEVDGILKRLTDRDGRERYLLKAVATHPSIDLADAGKRGVEGVFSVERRQTCR